MTAFQRVRRTQQSLKFFVGASALLYSAAVSIIILAAGKMLQRLIELPATAQVIIPAVSLSIALATMTMLARRGRFAWSLVRVALWLEERAPELRYAMVTAIDARYSDSMRVTLDPVIAEVDTRPFVWHAAKRSLVPATGALVFAIIMYTALPLEYGKIIRGARVAGGADASAPAANRLEPLRATVTPPAYANMPKYRLDDPATIAGLAGSRVSISGNGSSAGLGVRLGESRLPVEGRGNNWHTEFTLPDSAAALRLSDRHYQRLVVVDPRRDEPPAVKLLLPARDSTIRSVAGSIRFEVEIGDDVGIAAARLEYILASGESEGNFTFRQGTLGERSFQGSKSGRLREAIALASFKLKPGDQLSIRAVAFDNNALSGPGKGYSETRTIRLATQEEYDSLSVTAAPPSADTALMTLRLLILKTETLDRKRASTERTAFVSEAQVLGGESDRLRQKIEQIRDQQTGGGEIAADPLFASARDAMWEATRSLLIAETGEAIPPMYVALKALEKLRTARRFYSRARVEDVLVNIERVRLAGTDTGRALARRPRGMVESSIQSLVLDYAEAVRKLRSSPDSAVDALALMRIVAVRRYPDVATALGDAIVAVRTNRDATVPLLRVRRLLEGRSAVSDTLPGWTGAW
ncbi:MAG: hypothetical protein H0U13_02620 [Gemmatimonadaceae bacterium]|nr:hypothetical protein [Gemmatimonadaceae bacterium]